MALAFVALGWVVIYVFILFVFNDRVLTVLIVAAFNKFLLINPTIGSVSKFICKILRKRKTKKSRKS